MKLKIQSRTTFYHLVTLMSTSLDLSKPIFRVSQPTSRDIDELFKLCCLTQQGKFFFAGSEQGVKMMIRKAELPKHVFDRPEILLFHLVSQSLER